MSSQTQPNRFVKPVNFVKNVKFKAARLQLAQTVMELKPHRQASSIRNSGKRWEKLLDIMYDQDNGLPRGYSKYKDGRNFRNGFIEKVFEEVKKVINDNQLNSDETIIDLNEIATIYFNTKKVDEEQNELRNTMKEQTKKTMVEFLHDSFGEQ